MNFTFCKIVLKIDVGSQDKTLGSLLLKPLVITLNGVMGNTASSQPIQFKVQSLVIGETNFHNDTLTYILISLGITVVLGVMFYFYSKYRQRGRLARPMTAARRLQEMEAQHHANIQMSQPFPYGGTKPNPLPSIYTKREYSPYPSLPTLTRATTAPPVNE